MALRRMDHYFLWYSTFLFRLEKVREVGWELDIFGWVDGCDGSGPSKKKLYLRSGIRKLVCFSLVFLLLFFVVVYVDPGGWTKIGVTVTMKET